MEMGAVRVSSDRLEEPGNKLGSGYPWVLGKWFIHYTMVALVLN